MNEINKNLEEDCTKCEIVSQVGITFWFLLNHAILFSLIGVFIRLILNYPAFFNADVLVKQSIISSLSGAGATLVASAIVVMVVICVLGFLITFGSLTYLVLTGSDPWSAIVREIRRLSAICPLFFWNATCSFIQYLICRTKIAMLAQMLCTITIGGLIVLTNFLVVNIYIL